jgi:acyl dehydratase
MEHSGRQAFERYLDGLQIGDRFVHWPGRTITEAANEAFCFWTMNQQPLHLDAEYSRQSQHGQRLVNGLLVMSIAVGVSIPGLSGNTIANLGYDKVVHHAPVFIGDTIYAETEVLDARPSKSRPDRGIVQARTRVWNQRGETVLTFERTFMLPRKAATTT